MLLIEITLETRMIHQVDFLEAFMWKLTLLLQVAVSCGLFDNLQIRPKILQMYLTLSIRLTCLTFFFQSVSILTTNLYCNHSNTSYSGFPILLILNRAY